MAIVSREDILKLGELAKLGLTDEQVEQFAVEINEILAYVKQLQKVDVTGLEPTYQVTGLTNVTRSDEVINYGVSPKTLLKNAPALEGSQIKVKRVL